jgi:hypothetical protein
MSDRLNDDETLTKPKQKKERSTSQLEATKKMLSALEDKKLKLKALKDKLNNAPPIPQSDSSSDEEPEPVKAPAKLPKETKPPKAPKQPKEPKIVYQTDSESEEEEVVIVKKRKKPKKKTIIYEESESEEEVIQKKSRDTKTQQNKSSFKVTPNEAKPIKPTPLYYFA